MADAQVWTVIALLAAAIFAVVIEMRRMNDRMTDGFATLGQDINDLRLEVRQEFGHVRAEIAAVRTDLGAEIVAVRTDLGAEIVAVRTDLGAEIAELRNDLRWHVGHNHRPSA